MADCSERAADEAQRLVPLVEDWGAVVEEAVRQGLLPVVYRYLAGHGKGVVPQAVMNDLRMRYHGAVAGNIRLIDQLFSVMSLLQGHGIGVMPYKGPVLSSQLYGDPCLRPCCDVDFLVRMADAQRARDLLVEAGYEPEVSVGPRQEGIYLRQQCEYTLRRRNTGVAVELHWAIAQKAASFGFDAASLWDDPVGATVEGREVPTVAPAKMLLVMAIHNGAKHQWERLLWVIDFARLISRVRLPWQEVMALARRLGMRRSVVVGSILARDVAGIALPAELEEAAGADPVAARLADHIAERLFDGGATVGKMEHFKFSLALREGLASKARFCALQLTTPSHWELAGHDLPPFMAPAYGLIKVWKWVRR